MKKRKSLKEYTPKQAAFFYWYSVLGNATRAALKVYYPDFPMDKAYSNLTEKEGRNYNTASQIGQQNLRKHPNFLQLFLDEQGLDFKKLAEKMKQGLEATKPIGALVLATTGKDGVVRTKGNEGMIEVPDMPEQREWWDRFARMLNVKVREFPPVIATQQQVNVFGNAVEKADEFVEGEEVS